MRFGVMITHGPGGHPPWKHAEVTADKLIVPPLPQDDLDGSKRNAADDLRRRVRDLLVEYHQRVRDHELEQLVAHGAARHGHPLQPEEQHVGDAVAAVVALAAGTVLEQHYARPEVQQAMREVIAHEFRTQMHVHRLDHASQGSK